MSYKSASQVISPDGRLEGAIAKKERNTRK